MGRRGAAKWDRWLFFVGVVEVEGRLDGLRMEVDEI